MNQVRDLLYLLFGYLSGCVLYAEVFSRVFHKEIASAAKDKNPGAANAFVHGGFWCGVLTLAGDMLKGMVPVALYMHYLPEALLTPLAPLVLCAPVAGHVFPATRSFRGGKGIATSFGCLLVVFPVQTLCAFGVFLLLVAATRYVSAGSLGAAVTLPFFIMFTTPCDPVIWGSIIAICLLAIWRHTPNIRRLMNHTESKINLGKGKKAA